MKFIEYTTEARQFISHNFHESAVSENNIENIWVVDTKKDCLKVSHFCRRRASFIKYQIKFELLLPYILYYYYFVEYYFSEFSNKDVDKVYNVDQNF